MEDERRIHSSDNDNDNGNIDAEEISVATSLLPQHFGRQPFHARIISNQAEELGGEDENAYSKLDCRPCAVQKIRALSSNLVSVDLSSNNLKTLPESLFNDVLCLEALDLHSNQLPVLSDSIGNLKRLKVLDVSGNLLKELPQGIGGCRSLVELEANFNELERLPAGLASCKELQRLSLHSNKLMRISPALLRELKGLKFLDLHFNKLLTLPPEIGDLQNLQVLDLSFNSCHFGRSLPDHWSLLLSLLELDLSYNQIKVVPPSLGALKNLQRLNLEGNPLSIPPIRLLDHSFEALKEYLADRWHQHLYDPHYTDKTSPCDEEEPSYPSCIRLRRKKKASSFWLTDLLVWKCGDNSSHHLLSKKEGTSDYRFP